MQKTELVQVYLKPKKDYFYMRTKGHKLARKVPWLTSPRLCFRDESLMIDCVRCCLLCVSQSLATSLVVLVHFTFLFVLRTTHIWCGTHNKCNVRAYCLYLVLMSRCNITKLFALDCFRNIYSVCFIIYVVLYFRSKTILGAQQVKTCKFMFGYDVIQACWPCLHFEKHRECCQQLYL